MRFSRNRRGAGRIVLAGAVLAGISALALTAVHPAAATALLHSVQSAVTCASSAACVTGTNTSWGPGVSGTSAGGNGVSGTSPMYYGVYGTSSDGDGVYGHSTNGFGVFADSSYSDGVLANANGSSANASGVRGVGVEAMGVSGFSANGDGGYFQTIHGQRAVVGLNANGDGAEFAGSYIGIIGRAPTNGYPMDLVTESNSNLFLVDGLGDAFIAGNLTVNGTVHGHVSTASGSPVSAFVAQTAAPTIEDTGTAQLSAGVAAVRLDPTFAASIDGRQSYRVFVTPDGDTNGLYVAAKTAAGFIVREIHGGRSTLAFDYRIVATAWGESGKRSTVMTGSPMPAARVLPLSSLKPPTAAPLKIPGHP